MAHLVNIYGKRRIQERAKKKGVAIELLEGMNGTYPAIVARLIPSHIYDTIVDELQWEDIRQESWHKKHEENKKRIKKLFE